MLAAPASRRMVITRLRRLAMMRKRSLVQIQYRPRTFPQVTQDFCELLMPVPDTIAELLARQPGAVRNGGVVGDSEIPIFGLAGFGIPHAAENLGWTASAQQFQHARPVGQAVRIDNTAGAIAEQRKSAQVVEQAAAGDRFLRHMWIILGDPVAARLVPARPERLDAGVRHGHALPFPGQFRPTAPSRCASW